jgi:hypothetical protein
MSGARIPMLKKITSAMFAICFAGGVASASLASVSEKPAIPPDLFFEFKPVPPAENAIINWRRAAELEVALDSQQEHSISFCWVPGAKEPPSADLEGLQTWLKRNREARELFDASLKKASAQWPERIPQNPQPEMKALILLNRARLFEADQFAEQGKFDAAADLLLGSLKLAQSGVEGDAAVIHYLIACRARSAAQDAMLRLACRKEVPVPVVQRMLTNLPSLDSETNIYGRVLRAEFIRDYHDHLDLKKLTETLSKMSGTNAVLFLSLFPEDMRRAFQILLDPSLEPLHPNPYDANEEISDAIKHYRIYRDNALASWAERDGQVELDNLIAHTNLLEEIAPLMERLKDEPLPLSQRAAQRARSLYEQIKNPIGRVMDTSVIGFVGSDLKVFQVRAEREAARTYLALKIFERRKGKLPVTLSELVSEKLLDAVLIDPFCGRPLQYSQAKRRIWSVSDNGEDDHGESGNTRWYQKDAVWQIPETN